MIVGAHNIKVTESTQQSRPVIKWTNHEHYHSGNIQNDIALVEHGIFYENQFVRPIQVPAMQDDEWLHEGDRMRVCGWGTGFGIVFDSPLLSKNHEVGHPPFLYFGFILL